MSHVLAALRRPSASPRRRWSRIGDDALQRLCRRSSLAISAPSSERRRRDSVEEVVDLRRGARVFRYDVAVIGTTG